MQNSGIRQHLFLVSHGRPIYCNSHADIGLHPHLVSFEGTKFQSRGIKNAMKFAFPENLRSQPYVWA